ncbi:MAG: hypothetical protein CVU41_10415 [Chloroflexi bacterium HGW-Chloroflexi-3]|nr:MAG: hypothetical protein CVU41_10415 [Chloroflexi bacterium HGW-Chloroflexi-3]
MKKIFIVLFILVGAALLASCVELPDEPQEYLPWCKEQYQQLLAEYPDYPPAFIGACVSTMQTGKPTAYVSLCGYEPFRESLEDPSITTKKECIQYILNYGE